MYVFDDFNVNAKLNCRRPGTLFPALLNVPKIEAYMIIE